MKYLHLSLFLVFALAGPAALMAQEPTTWPSGASPAAPPGEQAVPARPGSSGAMPGMGMMRHGGGGHGKGHGGMKHGGGQHGKGHEDKHRQVVQRLDLIEARLAKIEAMLESLMRR